MHKYLIRPLLLQIRRCIKTSRTGFSGHGSPLAAARQSERITAPGLALLLSAWSTPSFGGIFADNSQPGERQPEVFISAEGVPQVNIAPPNEQGMSHNIYTSFDVDSQGVILNNSGADSTTSLSGPMAGNPRLAEGGATVILNEVNSTHPSQLFGAIEVAGDSAQVVIANPAGITCNGCGFINTHHAILAAGRPEITDGKLEGFDQIQGNIVVNGAGMDNRNVDHTEIIARSVKINASLWAKQLDIVARDPSKPAGGKRKHAADEFSIDVSRLGGMYANKIHLIGTESGLGVRNAGHIGAQSGDLSLTVDGHIHNTGSILGDEVQLLINGNMDNQGKISALGNAEMKIDGALSQSGTLTALGDLQIKAASLNAGSAASMTAGLKKSKKSPQGGNLTVVATGNLQAKGRIQARGDLSLEGAKIDLSSGTLKANRVTLNAKQGELRTVDSKIKAQNRLVASSSNYLDNQRGRLSSHHITLEAPELNNNQGTIEHKGDEVMSLKHEKCMHNYRGTILCSGNNLLIDSPLLDNRDGEIKHSAEGKLEIIVGVLVGLSGNLHSNGNLQINAENLDFDQGNVSAATINIQAQNLSNKEGRIKQEGIIEEEVSERMRLNIANDLVNQKGHITSVGGVEASAETIDNSKGYIISVNQSPMTLIARKKLSNQQGYLWSGGRTNLETYSLDNINGDIHSLFQNVEIEASNEIDNRHGNIVAKQKLNLNGGELNNQRGTISAAEISLNTGVYRTNNNGGKINSLGGVKILSGALLNDRGAISAGADLEVNTVEELLKNSNSERFGGLIGQKSVQISCGKFDNSAGRLIGGPFILPRYPMPDNVTPDMASKGKIILITHELDNQKGLIQSGDSLNINTQNRPLINQDSGTEGGIYCRSKLLINSGEVNNVLGKIHTQSKAQLLIKRGLNNHSGSLHSGGKMLANCGMLNNDGGIIHAKRGLSLRAESYGISNRYSGQGNGIQSDDDLEIFSRNGIDNRDGMIMSTNSAHIRAGCIINERGIINSFNDNLILSTGEMNNQFGLIQSKEGITMDTHSFPLTNIGSGNGTCHGIYSHGVLQIETGLFDNRFGYLQSDSHMLLNTGDVLNNAGKILGAGTAGLNTSMVTNNGGQIRADRELTMLTRQQPLKNRSSGSEGGIHSKAGLRIDSGPLDNGDGKISSANRLILISPQIANQGGKLSGGHTIEHFGSELINRQDQINGQQNPQALYRFSVDNSRGLIEAEADIRLKGSAVTNHTGTLQSDREVFINTDGMTLDNRQGTIKAKRGATLLSGNLQNLSGILDIFGPLTIRATQAQINNVQGFIQSSEKIDIEASHIVNKNNEAFVGRVISINADELDNRDGKIHAAEYLGIYSKQKLDNNGGLLSADKLLEVGNAQTIEGLHINNGMGELFSKQDVRVMASSLSSAGKISSDKNLSLSVLNGPLHNQSKLEAKENLSFLVSGELINDKSINAGERLSITALQVKNGCDARVEGKDIVMYLQESLNNQGLIRGNTASIRSESLNCQGGGRIYGNRVALEQQTLSIGETGEGAIAARERLDIGGRVVNNQRKGLIYSAGELVMGSELDGQMQAQGQAAELNNFGIVKADANMALHSNNIRNYNFQLKTENRIIDRQARHEVRLKDDSVRYERQDITLEERNSHGFRKVLLPDGRSSRDFDEIYYHRSIIESRPIASEPAQLVTGGDMLLSSRNVHNLDSHILAGGKLDCPPMALKQMETLGKRTQDDIGFEQQWRVIPGQEPGIAEQTKTIYAYRPMQVEKQIALNYDELLRKTRIPASDAAPAVETVHVNGFPPANALFTVETEPNAPSLVRIDPDFTAGEEVMSIDYMLRRVDPGVQHKSLGDGSYQLELINQQVAKLHKTRRLPGYDNDELQYKALMDEGISMGLRYGFLPGDALNAGQMAQIAASQTDMVWPVEQEVILADGTSQRVIVPQLYSVVPSDTTVEEGVSPVDNPIVLRGHNAASASQSEPPLTPIAGPSG